MQKQETISSAIDKDRELNLGLPECTPHLIAYFDVIGYKFEVQKDEDEFLMTIWMSMCAFHSSMETTYNTLHNFTINLPENFEAKTIDTIKYKIFSDNVIMYCPITGNKHWDDFITVLILDACNNIQCHFCKLGIKLRGCITKGNLFTNKDFVYGSGLIRAVELEEKAEHTKIILDNEIEILDMFSEKFPLLEENTEKYNALDYLRYFYQRDIGNNERMRSMLQQHKKLVESIPNLGNTKAKYEWIKIYHNNFCEKYGFGQEIIIL
jgi:hypothetical protein